MTTIIIGEKKRPFKFGILAASTFCKCTGKSINDLNDISDADIDAVINVLHAGLVQGAKMAQKEVDFDADTVAIWMDDIDQKEITKAFESMQDDKAPVSKKKVK